MVYLREMTTNKKVTTEKAVKSLSTKRLITYWLRPVWIILALMLVLFLFVLTTSRFDWVTAWHLLIVLLPVYGLMLATMYVLWYLVPTWPLETGMITLLIMFSVYLFASLNDNNLALQLRTYLSEHFNTDFFAVSMTLGGLLVALYAIYIQQRKQKRN